MDILVSEEAGVRYLHFSSNWIQGAMRIARPWALELDYTREMMGCLLLRPESDWPRRALLVGLGAGSLTKFLRRHRPATRLTVVEIEAQVVATAHQYFKLPETDEFLNIAIGDGADFVAESRRRFDLIMVDGYDAKAGTGRLNTLPFFLDCKVRLSDDGLLVTNLLSRRKDFRNSVHCLRQAFDDRVLVFPPCDSGNVVAVAAVGANIDMRLADMRSAARLLKRETSLNLLPTLARLESSENYPAGRVAL
jgi:spermidine synthase